MNFFFQTHIKFITEPINYSKLDVFFIKTYIIAKTKFFNNLLE